MPGVGYTVGYTAELFCSSSVSLFVFQDAAEPAEGPERGESQE